jgi:hypothetical protein
MQPLIGIAILTLLIIRRLKRSIGFQKYNNVTIIVRMVLFGIIALFILAFDLGFNAIFSPAALIPDAIGILAGLILAYIATNHAQFEKREDGLYFKTHIWVESLVVALFLGRFIYRIFILKDIFQPNQTGQDHEHQMQYMHDPFTRSVLFVFCTYYLGYFSFILKEGKKASNTQL